MSQLGEVHIMLRTYVAAVVLISAPGLWAQDFGQIPSPETPAARTYPILQISYYAGPEGAGRQELIRFDLDQWTPEKDVIISSKWIPPSGLTAPGARSPDALRNRDPFKDRAARFPTRRQWIVEYADAATEGESHLFVNGVGLPKFSRQIHRADDIFGYAHIPSRGWYEVRKAARAYRDWLANRHLNEDETEPPPSDTQNPFDTRSR